MKEALFSIDEINNRLLQSSEGREELRRLGALDDAGCRVRDEQLVLGDVITGRLFAIRCSRNGRRYKQDVGWPNRMTMEPDGDGIDEGSAALLKGLVIALQPNVVLETGTHKGRSTKAILEGLVTNERGCMHTVDKDDYGTFDGFLSDEENGRLTKVIGKTPDIFSAEPLDLLSDIEFAYLDGAHDETIYDELKFVEARVADSCCVVIDNVNDDCWPGFNEAITKFLDEGMYRRVTINTLCGFDIIQIGDGQ